jgi:transglutaminase-like putative cysteine protease
MVVRVSGVEPGAAIPSDDTQRYDNAGLLTISSRQAPAANLTFPEHDPAFAHELAADPLIQSEAPEIKSQAQSIVGAETDRWIAATALYHWVYESLDKKMVFSVPSALEVLKSREGDCNEHTTLYVALARAVGIPARIAIGVVWSDEYKGFYYHAWPEVYAGAWVWIDPTLGQPIADAAHIKLLNGNVDQWGKLLPFVGKAQLEVVEAQ